MDGGAAVLFWLVVIGGALAFAHVVGRLNTAERRLRDIDLELGRLRRQRTAVDGEAAVPPATVPGVADAAPADAPAQRPDAAPTPVVEARPASGPPPREIEPEPIPPPAAPAPLEGGPALLAEVEPRPPVPPKRPSRVRIDWERWIGVRGAALLGGVVLALAAILFLKFSIERGLISPVMRVALGIVAGLGSLGGAEMLRKRAYGTTANALSGAGVVILYASIWAAHRLYGFVPVPLALLFLVLVTTTCGLLSYRHRSLVIAMLGLVGGFATPFLLASDRIDPVGLFGYILLLDVGLLALSRKRGWPLLAHLGLAGTLLYQALWVFREMAADRFLLTLVILAVFALLFAVAAGVRRPVEKGPAERRWTAAAGVSLPFAFALYLAARSDLGEHILPIAVLLLVLSAAACWMARVHGLALLPTAAAAACVAVVAVWAARTSFTSPTVWEAVGVAAALAAVFRFFPAGPATGAEGSDRAGRKATTVAAAGLLLVLLGSAVAASTGHLWPWLVGWLALTWLLVEEARAAGAGVGRWFLPVLAAVGQVVAVGIWLLQRQIGVPLAWEVAGVAVALGLFYRLLAPELSGRERRLFLVDAASSAPFVASAGLFWVLAMAPAVAGASGIWPWLAAWVALAALLLERGGTMARGYRQLVAGGLFAFAFVVCYLGRRFLEAPPSPAVLFGLALGVALVFQALAVKRRGGPVGRLGEAAAALFPGLLLLGLLLDVDNSYLPAGFLLAVGLFLAALIALAATRLPSGGLYLGAVVTLALVHSSWTAAAGGAGSRATQLVALGVQAAAVLLFTFWPFAAGRRLSSSRWALYGSALAGPLWFLSLERLWELRFGDGAIGALPLILGAVALFAAVAARRLWATTSPRRRRALVWYLAVTFAFVSVAIPLQLEKEWITVGWAIEGLALLVLWKRLDHPGLKYLGLALLAAVTLRLLVNPAVFSYYPRSGRPVVNWLMYTYLVPGVALLASGRLLTGLEVDRLLAWEASIYRLVKNRPAGAMACGLAAILVGFWWINLTVIDVFSEGRHLDLSFDRLPARDLSLSLSWAVYALLLLAVGMARRSVGLRWLSLGFLILTIGKVFLYDLGELEDLYRVASLVGLAVSLLLVSLAYQRFVFGRDREEETEQKTGGEEG